MITAMRDAYLAKAAADPRMIPSLRRRFVNITMASMPRCARLKSSEQRQSRSICRIYFRFAARAYRRPLPEDRDVTICSRIIESCGEESACPTKMPFVNPWSVC